MAVKLLDKKQATKDGRKWIFYDWVTQLDGSRKKYFSKKYATRKEALDAEKEFLTKYTNIGVNTNNMTFKKLYLSYYNYQADKVKFTTIKTYKDRVKFFKDLDNVKVNTSLSYTLKDGKNLLINKIYLLIIKIIYINSLKPS